MCVFYDSEVYNDIKCDSCPATDLCNSDGKIISEIMKLISSCIKYENDCMEQLREKTNE